MRVDPSEISHVLANFPEADISWFPQGLSESAPTSIREAITSLHYVVVDLDFILAAASYEVDAVLDGIVECELPLPCLVVATGGGFHAYWSIGAQYIGKRPGEDVQEADSRREYWLCYYESVTKGLCAALAEFGADQQASPATHLFRLPGSYAPKHNETTFIAYVDRKAQTTLKTLRQGLERVAPRIGITLEDPAVTKSRKYNQPPRCTTIDTPAIQWILANEVRDGGGRHPAIFCLSQAYLFSGYSEKETIAHVLAWNKTNCIPPKSPQEVEQVARACARRHRKGTPLGIDHRRLAELHNVAGESMGLTSARTIYRGLPGAKEFPERTRKHRKRRWNSDQALEHAILAIEAGRIEGVLTDAEVADLLGVPVDTFKKCVKPRLKAMGYCFTNVHKVPCPSIYVRLSTRASISTTYNTDYTPFETAPGKNCEAVRQGILHGETSATGAPEQRSGPTVSDSCGERAADAWGPKKALPPEEGSGR